ncbi:MAG: sigma-70 family RNA polymerase sigma factor [Oscillospiraceae bacterium]|nr:sigma-70 family RNA polymerase sigma factor [Oscillospiraceae bacterium]
MEDIEIIDLYWSRSESAIMETAVKYGRYLMAIANNILTNENDSEECVNDAYLGAWNAMPSQRPNYLKAFLGKIARNIALGKYDYNKAKKRNSEFDLILSELEGCVSSPESVESSFDEDETAKIISDFLRLQTDGNRGIFLRRYWYADSIGSIAVRFSMSESKVKSILFRMRGKLKIHLEKEGVLL